MNNSALPLQDLFKLKAFQVPPYQRAYAWEKERHLPVFLQDLRQQAEARARDPSKEYFLGTLLLHEREGNQVDIVDSQQRLTTSVIFASAALARNKEQQVLASPEGLANQLQEYFVRNSVENQQKLSTIEEDNPFFRSQILQIDGDEVSTDSPSSRRLGEAFDFFQQEVEDNEWAVLVDVLVKAQVMVYSVSNQADATLIFELQNDRGKRLTDLEALKSFLMHTVYLNAPNPDDDLQTIQTQFSKIYRQVEHLANMGLAKIVPSEDAVLSYHCAAYLEWTKDEWRQPKDCVKAVIAKQSGGEALVGWVTNFVSGLLESYKNVVTLMTEKLDAHDEIAELVLTGRTATVWPLLLKAYKYDSEADQRHFRQACRLMEVFAMRSAVSGLRADASLFSLYSKAKEFAGNFHDLHAYLHSISSWHDLGSRSRDVVSGLRLHKNGPVCRYLLWRYENQLRAQRPKLAERLPWKQLLAPSEDGTRLTMEHITAQNHPDASVSVEWEAGDPQPFSEVALHRLGNLVLDNKSPNASKGAKSLAEKLPSLNEGSTFLSQGELRQGWAVEDGAAPRWTVESIKRRQRHMEAFFKETWNPDTYFSASAGDYVEEGEEEDDLD